MRFHRVAFLFAFCCIAFGTGSAHPALFTAFAQTPQFCSAPEYRQFDFWVGDWDVFDVGAKAPTAHAKVSRILGGCVLLEEYEDTSGSQGKSFSIYDSSRRVWHQTWVTNRGQLLWIEGHYANQEMVLTGVEQANGGLQKQVRGTWMQVPDGVRETAVTSVDGGKHWDLWFDLMFRPRKQ
jgi:hypothetical protein